jgi:hypothetical protein
MEYLERSEELTGYRVKIVPREAFRVTGYTLIVAPADDVAVPQFWSAVKADGRLAKLIAASSAPTWVLGLGSWDEACEKKGFRYTICIPETPFTDFAPLAQEQPLHSEEIGVSEWMCFEITTQERYFARFWKDDPYRMMKVLGYRFFAGNPGTGLHFDAYPPGYDPVRQPLLEFWITVTRRKASARD